MKKAVLVVFTLLATMSFVFASSSKESPETINLGVMSGPTGFSSAMLGDFVNVTICPSPQEAVAKLVNGELDAAAVAANAAATLFNKGTRIKAVAIIGEGMLSVLGSDMQSKSIAVPGAGGTPDHMANLLYSRYQRDYGITAPAQLAQMLIQGSVSLAILPQPFVNMVLSSNKNVQVFSDVQEEWKALTGQDQFPMTILLVSERFAKEHPDRLEKLESAYKNSIAQVVADPQAAGARIEELGIMKADLAAGAIADCALVYKNGQEARQEAASYFEKLMELAPEAIGNKVPSDDFWL